MTAYQFYNALKSFALGVASMDAEWFVIHPNGNQTGPYVERKLREMAALGQITEETMLQDQMTGSTFRAGDLPFIGLPTTDGRTGHKRVRMGFILGLFSFGLIVTPLVLLVLIYQTWTEIGDENPTSLNAILVMEMCVNLAQIFFVAIVAFYFFQRRAIARKLVLAMLIFNMCFLVMDSSLVAGMDMEVDGGVVIRQIVIAIMWASYFARSTHVKQWLYR